MTPRSCLPAFTHRLWQAHTCAYKVNHVILKIRKRVNKEDTYVDHWLLHTGRQLCTHTLEREHGGNK